MKCDQIRINAISLSFVQIGLCLVTEHHTPRLGAHLDLVTGERILHVLFEVGAQHVVATRRVLRAGPIVVAKRASYASVRL